MADRLILVRHALPEATDGLTAAHWPLSEAGREDTVLLAHHLPGPLGLLLTSPERKARETATVIGLRLGLPVHEDARLREADRPDEWVEDYRERALAYLRGEEAAGWEPREAVLRRFSTAIEERGQETEDGLVAVAHGLVMALYVAARTGVDAATWWETLTLPDAWIITAGGRSAARPTGWAPAPPGR